MDNHGAGGSCGKPALVQGPLPARRHLSNASRRRTRPQSGRGCHHSAASVGCKSDGSGCPHCGRRWLQRWIPLRSVRKHSAGRSSDWQCGRRWCGRSHFQSTSSFNSSAASFMLPVLPDCTSLEPAQVIKGAAAIDDVLGVDAVVKDVVKEDVLRDAAAPRGVLPQEEGRGRHILKKREKS